MWWSMQQETHRVIELVTRSIKTENDVTGLRKSRRPQHHIVQFAGSGHYDSSDKMGRYTG